MKAYSKSRRIFCRNLLIGGTGAVLMSSCSVLNGRFLRGKPVLKFPENADEIVDFWEFFAEPDFTPDAAVKRLDLTGKPDEMKQSEDSVWATYPKQNDLIESVRIDAYKGQIDEMYINYSKPLQISLGRLEYLFGEPRNYGGPVGFISGLTMSFSEVAANRGPNSPSTPYYMGFGFEAKHVLPDGRTVMGTITVSADGDFSIEKGSKTRNVTSVEFTKYRN